LKISYHYLVDPIETRQALAAFVGQPVIGLDTETFRDSSTGRNQLSLLQLATSSGEILVIDGLAAGITEARSVIEDAEVPMVAHNARFDDGSLKEAGFKPAGLIDTLRLARRTLELRSFSLAAVAEHLCGMTLDKTYQRSNWRQRPLERAQLDYAALDACAVLQVYEALSARLQIEGRWEKEVERAHIDARPARERGRPKARPEGALRPLTADEQSLLERLLAWRQQAARSIGLPAYFVCPERTLEDLVVIRPQSVDQLLEIFGLGPSRIERYGHALLEHLR
jgi:ribonuclease D